jgi:hypothetical protein
MELHYATVVILASKIFVLSGMVGYLYWQQTRMLQQIQSLALVLSTHLTPPKSPIEEVHEVPAQEEHEQEPEHESIVDDEIDDRVSVKADVEFVEGPPEKADSVITAPPSGEPDRDDVDDLQGKTAAQLRELLTKKGIPFGKRDAKPVLIQLLKATA